MSCIIKVQLPIVGEEGVALIYDKKRRHMQTRPLLKHELDAMGSEFKRFFYGTWSSVVGWAIGAQRHGRNGKATEFLRNRVAYEIALSPARNHDGKDG